VIASETVVGRVPDARIRRVGKTQLLARGDTIVELNETGTLIWKLADGKRSVQEISVLMQQEYDVAPDEARADAVEFITELLDARLMKVVE
jgi:hypothetical protein